MKIAINKFNVNGEIYLMDYLLGNIIYSFKILCSVKP